MLEFACKMHYMRWPLWASLQRSPRPPSWFWGGKGKMENGEEEEGKGRTEGDEREGGSRNICKKGPKTA